MQVSAPFSVLEKDFLFVVGKGGVGKTTVSGAIALAAASRGKRVLIALCNAKERLSQLLEVAPIGHKNQPILPNIEAVNMIPEVAMEEYGLMVLKVRALYRAVFENRFVSAFLKGTPGLDAWSLLGKAYYHAIETDEYGRKRYDLVIVDAHATGHGLDMLRVPQVIVDVAPPGLLRREAERALDLFRDPIRSSVVLVSLAQDMPVNETIELYEAATKELRLPVGQLVVNEVLEEIFAPTEKGLIESLPYRLAENAALRSAAIAGRARALRENVQRESLAKLRAAIALEPIHLPHLFVPEFGREEIDKLATFFTAESK